MVIWAYEDGIHWNGRSACFLWIEPLLFFSTTTTTTAYFGAKCHHDVIEIALCTRQHWVYCKCSRRSFRGRFRYTLLSPTILVLIARKYSSTALPVSEDHTFLYVPGNDQWWLHLPLGWPMVVVIVDQYISQSVKHLLWRQGGTGPAILYCR